MRRTSVLIDVEDKLYSEVVEPMKRNKSFTKLVVSLLNGYQTDGYIRAYIDDTLEEVHKAVVGSFEDSVGDMESVLANMGLLTDELQFKSQHGYNKFKSHGETQAQEFEKETPKEPESAHSEVEDLRARVDDLEKVVSEGFEKVLSALNSNVGARPVAPEPTVQSRSEDIIQSSVAKIIPQDEPEVVNVPQEQEDEDTVGEDQANNFLLSLVSDLASY